MDEDLEERERRDVGRLGGVVDGGVGAEEGGGGGGGGHGGGGGFARSRRSALLLLLRSRVEAETGRRRTFMGRIRQLLGEALCSRPM